MTEVFARSKSMLRALDDHEKTMSCTKDATTKLSAVPSDADHTAIALSCLLPSTFQREDKVVSKCRRTSSLAQKDDDLHQSTKKRVIPTMGFALWGLLPLKSLLDFLCNLYNTCFHGVCDVC